MVKLEQSSNLLRNPDRFMRTASESARILSCSGSVAEPNRKIFYLVSTVFINCKTYSLLKKHTHDKKFFGFGSVEPKIAHYGMGLGLPTIFLPPQLLSTGTYYR